MILSAIRSKRRHSAVIACCILIISIALLLLFLFQIHLYNAKKESTLINKDRIASFQENIERLEPEIERIEQDDLYQKWSYMRPLFTGLINPVQYLQSIESVKPDLVYIDQIAFDLEKNTIEVVVISPDNENLSTFLSSSDDLGVFSGVRLLKRGREVDENQSFHVEFRL